MKDFEISNAIEDIAKNYFICKNHFRLQTFSSGKPDFRSPYYKYYRDVEMSINHLISEEQLIIRYGFFMPPRNTLWNLLYVDDEHFRELKSRAMKNFLRFFNENH